MPGTVNLEPTLSSVHTKNTFTIYDLALFEGKDMPTDTNIDTAIEWAMNNYQPGFKPNGTCFYLVESTI